MKTTSDLNPNPSFKIPVVKFTPETVKSLLQRTITAVQLNSISVIP